MSNEGSGAACAGTGAWAEIEAAQAANKTNTAARSKGREKRIVMESSTKEFVAIVSAIYHTARSEPKLGRHWLPVDLRRAMLAVRPESRATLKTQYRQSCIT
jgi:hypothetical protein